MSDEVEPTQIIGAKAGGIVRLRLPATSANVGPGFDTVAVALDFYLDVEAEAGEEFSIQVTGRNADRIAEPADNLIFNVYRRILEENGRTVVPLALRMKNGIPLGMGCGSSAAGRLAGIILAVDFGRLGWSDQRILEEATTLEGHPDNAAACWLGGFVAAACEGRTVHVARVIPPANWRVIVVMPSVPLPTSQARAVLPQSYSREDVVANLQSVSMLGLAFAQGRGDLLRVAMRDRVHQPYRAPICAYLPRLLPLAGTEGILGAALSGAGSAVLTIVEADAMESATRAIRGALEDMPEAELIYAGFEGRGVRELSPLL
jgi:homoserine kinase